jgi:hypothetical protein
VDARWVPAAKRHRTFSLPRFFLRQAKKTPPPFALRRRVVAWAQEDCENVSAFEYLTHALISLNYRK